MFEQQEIHMRKWHVKSDRKKIILLFTCKKVINSQIF